jgi:hypothetical protein
MDQSISAIRNRIVDHGVESPDQLLANPKNWRIHPEIQQKSMLDVLERVGWVQSVIVNKRTNFLVDGHLRVSLAMRRNETQIPVSYVDLSDDEESLILATFNPLAGLAITDQAQIRSLVSGVSMGGVEDLLDSIGFSFDQKKEPKKIDLRPFTKNHILISILDGADLSAITQIVEKIEGMNYVEVTRASN